MKMKIALTISTGRPQVKKVVKAFLDNAIMYGHNSKDFSIYLSIDKSYENTELKEFKLGPEIESMVNKTEYITEEKRESLGKEIIEKCGADSSIIRQLFIGNGYSKQRNAALFYAIKDKNDIAICVDDDEAPFIPIKKKNGKIEWKNLDFFGPHIKELSSGTDITRGPYMGYESPVPSDFEKDIPEEIREKLGNALAYGNEIISSYSFLNLMNKIKYLPEEELSKPSRPFTVKQGPTGKNILTGNMGINLHSVRKGKIPIFYTPPKARGEDAIFALQIEETVVKEVNSYIFHDPFCMYPGIFEGNFPQNLGAIPVTDSTKLRFVSALIGWLKYAPILINLTSENEKDKKQRIEEMINKIEEPTKELALILKCPELNDCLKTLVEYSINVKDHFKDLSTAQKEWKNKIVPMISSR